MSTADVERFRSLFDLSLDFHQRAADEALPLILAGAGTDEAVEAAGRFWVALEDWDRSRYCYAAFIATQRRIIHPRVWSRILAWTWTRGRCGSLLSPSRSGLSYSELGWMFALATPDALMDTSELATYNALPEEIIVYRGAPGVTIGKARRGMSWTRDKSCAAWFGNRFAASFDKSPLCIQGTVRKADVLAYFDTEDEVVISSGRVRKVVEVPIRHATVYYDKRAQLVEPITQQAA